MLISIKMNLIMNSKINNLNFNTLLKEKLLQFSLTCNIDVAVQ